jgi:hypothetical protein
MRCGTEMPHPRRVRGFTATGQPTGVPSTSNPLGGEAKHQATQAQGDAHGIA